MTRNHACCTSNLIGVMGYHNRKVSQRPVGLHVITWPRESANSGNMGSSKKRRFRSCGKRSESESALRAPALSLTPL